MVYITHVQFYDDYDNISKNTNCFVYADTYVEAVEKMARFYGNDYIENIEVEVFSPDDFLEFQTDDIKEIDLFTEIKLRLSDRVIW